MEQIHEPWSRNCATESTQIIEVLNSKENMVSLICMEEIFNSTRKNIHRYQQRDNYKHSKL